MSDIPEFLLKALQFQGVRKEAVHEVSDTEWRRVLSDWHVVRLTLPLRLSCGDELPSWVRDRIDGFLTDTALRFERIKGAYSRVARALREAAVDHAVIKGFSLSPGYTDHPRLRPQSDIDLYCPPDQILRARDVLISLGYRSARRGFLPSDHLPALIPPSTWVWRGNYFDPEIPISFELHQCWWDCALHQIHLQGLNQFWSRRVSRTVDEFSFPALDPIDNLAYTSLNVLRTLLRDSPAPEQVYGLARFLHTSSENHLFWQKWGAIHDDSLRRLQAVSFRLASQWFNCSLSEEAREEVASLAPLVDRWFGYFLKSTHSTKFAYRKDGTWLHAELLDSRRDKIAVLFQHLTPLPDRVPSINSVLGDKSFETPRVNSLLFRLAQGVVNCLYYLYWLISRISSQYAPLPRALWRGISYQFARRNIRRPS